MSKWKSKVYQLLCLHFLFPLYYRWQCRRAVRPGKVLFIEVRALEMTSNFTLLNQALKQERYECTCFFLKYGRCGQVEYIRRCLALLKELATAECAFLNEPSNVASAVSLRKETKLIQTWHGCGAFKKFGYSVPGNLSEAFYHNYSMVTVSSPDVIPHFSEAMGIAAEKICPIGVSRTDRFFDRKYLEQQKDKLCQRIPEAKGRKIILYAPTFRGMQHVCATAPDRLDIALLHKALGQEYLLLLKNHPLVRERAMIEEEDRCFAKDVSGEMQIEELLCVSDICISDYSSLIFEYSLLLRPMIFFAYDVEEYYRERGFYYPYDAFTPGPVLKTTQEVAAYILHLKEGFEPGQIEAFRNKFMRACDGHATERIIRYLKGESNECS